MALIPTAPPLTNFKLLSFDVFGTLIDEETGIYNALQPLLSRCATPPSKASATELINRLETTIHAIHPSLLQSEILAHVYKLTASAWGISATEGEASAFASSMGEWEPFPDTVSAMQKISKHFKLVALSNCDRATFSRVLAGPLKDVKFNGVYLAEDIGTYKPDRRNFEYLLRNVEREFGVQQEEVLMVAHGLESDHVTCKEMGMHSAWIRRGTPEEVERMYEGKVAYQWRRTTLGDFADDVEREFEGYDRA
ncbi:MAG: hypothetical protein Q9201_001872 [Fulgogasparrea decipioides]